MDNFLEDEPQPLGADMVTPAPPSASSLLTTAPSTTGRKFVRYSITSIELIRFDSFSAQRKYDNIHRVRDSETSKRLCYECGEVVAGGEDKYQDHILLHEGVYLSYQLYHFENATGRRPPAIPPPTDKHKAVRMEAAREVTPPVESTTTGYNVATNNQQ